MFISIVFLNSVSFCLHNGNYYEVPFLSLVLPIKTVTMLQSHKKVKVVQLCGNEAVSVVLL